MLNKSLANNYSENLNERKLTEKQDMGLGRGGGGGGRRVENTEIALDIHVNETQRKC